MTWRRSKKTPVSPIDEAVASADAAPVAEVASVSDDPPSSIPGDRGIPSVNRAISVQARITRALALGLGAVVLALASVWYVKAQADRLTRPAATAEVAAKAKAAGESLVPPLGPLTPPVRSTSAVLAASAEEAGDAAEGEASVDDEESEFTEAVYGDRPEPPQWRDYAPASGEQTSAFSASPPVPMSAVPDRRLQGAVFVAANGLAPELGADTRASDSGESRPASTARESLLSTEMAQARPGPPRRWWLPKGTFLDCTLQTAIDSTLPGLVSGVLAADTYGADGQLVLLPRGTRLLGEVRSSVIRGQRRLMIIWQEARTPEGVIVALESPGTDTLGRAGVTGEVDRHFGERLGAAMLVSVLDGAVQAAVAAQRDGGNQVTVSPSGSQDIASEVLKDTIGIPPTIRVSAGERVQIVVARDVDFRGVYELSRRPG